MCTSPIKAYLLDKELIFKKIFEEKEFKNHYNELTKEIVTDITTEIYEKEGLCDKRYYKRISFKPPKNELANCYKMIELPCGKCDECRYKHAKMWANRCYLESKYHKKSCYITLSYNPENLPQGRTLVKTDLQKFWKRLRKYLSAREGGEGIKYFACGEYG